MKSLDSLSNQTVVLVRDMKPENAARDGKSIPFTISKEGFLQLQKDFPGRYKYEGEYRSQSQIRNMTKTVKTDGKPVAPAIENVTDGLKKATDGTIEEEKGESTTMSAADAIEKVERMRSVEKIEAFTKGEDRTTVTEAAEKRIEEIKSK